MPVGERQAPAGSWDFFEKEVVLNRYEGMFILNRSAEGQDLDDKLENIRAEIVKLGGTVESTTRLGRIPFARQLKKKESGLFVLITFAMNADAVGSLQDRYRYNEDVFRLQVTRARKRAVAKADEPAAAEVAPA